jgi:hypothetical protein
MEPLNIMLSFGPIAFGTVVLIVLWKIIVKPELDTRKLELQALELQIENISSLNEQIKQTYQSQIINTEALTSLVEAQRALLHDMRDLLDRYRDCK